MGALLLQRANFVELAVVSFGFADLEKREKIKFKRKRSVRGMHYLKEL